jgi:hypothetical protein
MSDWPGPTWYYHATAVPRLVTTRAQFDALGDGWHTSPADCVAPVPEPAEPPLPETVQAAVAQIEAAIAAQPEPCGKVSPSASAKACIRPAGHRGAHTYREAQP